MTEIVPDHSKVVAYFAERSSDDIADGLLRCVPWLSTRYAFDFSSWSTAVLARLAPEAATLYIVGSGAVGFSLSPTKAGAAFREFGAHGRPSDVDIAIVCDTFFQVTWAELLVEDKRSKGGVPDEVRVNVYRGRIDQDAVPQRSRSRQTVLALRGDASRQPQLRDYKVSIRLYRRDEDLRSYLSWSIRKLNAEVRK